MNDLRYALRLLLKNPGFTTVAVLVLGLGIGANTAVFGIINTLLLKPIVATRPTELMRVYCKENKPQGRFRLFSYSEYVALRDQNPVFSNLAAFTLSMSGIREGDITRRGFVAMVSANWLGTFGIRPGLGRDFRPEEERPGAGIPVAIVSHDYWRKHGSDPALVGRTITLNGRSFDIVGVAPKGFTGTTALFTPDAWVPLGVKELLMNDFQGGHGGSMAEGEQRPLFLLGRLKPGLTMQQAQAQLEPLATRLQPTSSTEDAGQTLMIGPPSRLTLNTNPTSDRAFRGLAELLFPMSGVVLLAACLNLANMLLLRGAARRKEFAVRAALGGGRWRIMRQLLIEGLVLSALGGVLAIVFASWTTSLLSQSLGAKVELVSVVFDPLPDARTLAATGGFCLLATLLSTLVPAWKLARADVVNDLKEQTGEERRSRRGLAMLAPRNLLVAAQLALAFVLVAAAALFYRCAVKAAKADPGFRFDQGLLVEVDASLGGLDETQGRALYRAALERLRSLPGVDSVSLASSVPFGMFSDGRQVRAASSSQGTEQKERTKDPQAGSPSPVTGASLEATGPTDQREGSISANYTIISDDYFKSLGVSMLRGREFDRLEAEGGASGRVCVISEELAKQLWPNEEAVGRFIEIAESKPENAPPVMEVVGVAPNFRQELGGKQAISRLYVPFGQAYQSMMNLHVRLERPDAALATSMLQTVRKELRSVSDRLPVLGLMTFKDFHTKGFVMWMFNAVARLFSVFALLVLTLAVVGVYGVKAFAVGRRTREIGIRIALGATRAQVLGMVLRDGLILVAAGLGVGFILALAVGRLIASKLYDVSATDPLSFSLTFAVLAAAALLATYFPARRATRIDPMSALRYE